MSSKKSFSTVMTIMDVRVLEILNSTKRDHTLIAKTTKFIFENNCNPFFIIFGDGLIITVRSIMIENVILRTLQRVTVHAVFVTVKKIYLALNKY